jgi:hypothetical protein
MVDHKLSVQKESWHIPRKKECYKAATQADHEENEQTILAEYPHSIY